MVGSIPPDAARLSTFYQAVCVHSIAQTAWIVDIVKWFNAVKADLALYSTWVQCFWLRRHFLDFLNFCDFFKIKEFQSISSNNS